MGETFVQLDRVQITGTFDRFSNNFSTRSAIVSAIIVVCPGHPKNLLPPVAAGDRRGILLGPCHHSC